MLTAQLSKIKIYLSTIYNAPIKISKISLLGNANVSENKDDLKEFGYGYPYLIEFLLNKELRRIVLSTMRCENFGHDHFSDRTKIMLWQNATFNKLPKHVNSIDVGAFTIDNTLKSLGDCKEFFYFN